MSIPGIMKEEVKDYEEFFRRAFELSPDAINLNRAHDGLYVLVNEGFINMSGYTREELIGRTSIELDIWADPEDREKLVKVLLESGKMSNLETRFMIKSGEIRYGIISAVLFNLNEVPYILSLTQDITERKNFEDALRESEVKYRRLISLAPDGILLGSHDGLITGVNSSMLKITGRTSDELIGSNINILFSPDELKENPLRYDILDKGELVKRERNIIRPNGSFVPVEMHTMMMPEGTYQMFCQDISDRRKAENELRKLSRAVEQNPSAIVITDPEGIIEYVNPKLCETTGFSKEELIGQNPRIWSSNEKTKKEYQEFWRTIKSGKEWKGEFHNRNKNGELFWESALVSPIKNEKSEIVHFLGIKENITLRKILEEKNRASEERYREMFVANPIPSFIFYEDTLEFIEVNDAAVINYGYSREEFASMTLKDIRPPEDIDAFVNMLKDIWKAPVHNTINRHMRNDRSIFSANVTSHSLPEKYGRKSRLLMCTDITESVKAAEQMKLAKEKAEASDKLKTTFLNNISHEVRTPLNGIMGFVDIITQTDLSEQDKRESVGMLVDSSNRLLNTITNYMDISLLTSGSMSLVIKDFNPVEVIKELFNKYERIYLEKNLRLIMDIPLKYESLYVSSDSELFSKAFSHLLDNAIKFTDYGSIHFGLRNSADHLEFYVKDTGLGINNESQKHIFDPFFKGVHVLTTQSQGSGLGLAIAKGLIELLGGNISMKSEPGTGSTFSFIIPSWNESMKIISVSKEANVIKNQSGNPLILIAEDDETNFFYLNALLKFETNAQVIHASNGREAIDIFKTNPGISLILMDVKMPEIDGLEATRQIKKIRKDIPIIGITAYSMSGDKERILAAGCDGYISKPINKKSLLQKMEEYINLKTV